MSPRVRVIGHDPRQIGAFTGRGLGGKRRILSVVDDLRNHDWEFSQLRVGWPLSPDCSILSANSQWVGFGGAFCPVSDNMSACRAQRAYYIGHLGKYVPGKAMVVVIRGRLNWPTAR